jgi:hypothetical protein
MRETLLKISLLCSITCLILGLSCWFGYRQGMGQGMATVQAKWDADKIAQQKFQLELQEQFFEQEALYYAKQEYYAHELALLRKNHATDLSNQRTIYEQRLLQSARRSEVYQSQAEASVASCRDLASHAARLDRALEEGRGLVEEFRETLRFREQQLIFLGEQILSDRQSGEAIK